MFGMATVRRTKKRSAGAPLYAVQARSTAPEADVMPELRDEAGLADVTEACNYYIELLDRRLFRLRSALRSNDSTRALVATRALCGTASTIGATDLDSLTASIEPWIRRDELRRASAALSTIAALVADAQLALRNQAVTVTA